MVYRFTNPITYRIRKSLNKTVKQQTEMDYDAMLNVWVHEVYIVIIQCLCIFAFPNCTIFGCDTFFHTVLCKCFPGFLSIYKAFASLIT